MCSGWSVIPTASTGNTFTEFSGIRNGKYEYLLSLYMFPEWAGRKEIHKKFSAEVFLQSRNQEKR